jgi:pimeloyl-ACP methyl ester carboxylesterase
MPLVSVGAGVSLYCEVSGEGPPVVFVHEFAGSCRSWDPQVAALSGRFRTVVYNCRGYPPSTVPEAATDYSQDHSVRDLHRLLAALGLDRVDLVGLSMGGSIALAFALRHPGHVRRLVVAVTGSGSEDKDAFRRQFSAVAERLEQEGTGPVAADYLIGPTRIQLKSKRPEAWRKLHREFCGLSPSGLANTIRHAIVTRPTVYELDPGLRAFGIPTLVITGEEDSHTVASCRFIAETVPGARLVVFERTGHTVNLEEPERFDAVVAGFLSD